MLRKFNAYNNREDGFTLIELLVVVLIIGILAAIAVPIYLNVQNGSKKSTLQSDVATTRLSVAAALTREKTLHDGTNSATVGTTVSNSNAVSDEIVKVDIDTDDENNFTVIASSIALDYSYKYDSATKQSTVDGGTITPPAAPIADIVKPSGADVGRGVYYIDAVAANQFTVSGTTNPISSADKTAAQSIASWYSSWLAANPGLTPNTTPWANAINPSAEAQATSKVFFPGSNNVYNSYGIDNHGNMYYNFHNASYSGNADLLVNIADPTKFTVIVLDYSVQAQPAASVSLYNGSPQATADVYPAAWLVAGDTTLHAGAVYQWSDHKNGTNFWILQ